MSKRPVSRNENKGETGGRDGLDESSVEPPPGWPRFVRALQRKEQLSSAALARRIGVSTNRVFQWVNGTHKPSIDTLRSISAEFKHPMPLLLLESGLLTDDELIVEMHGCSLAIHLARIEHLDADEVHVVMSLVRYMRSRALPTSRAP